MSPDDDLDIEFERIKAELQKAKGHRKPAKEMEIEEFPPTEPEPTARQQIKPSTLEEPRPHKAMHERRELEPPDKKKTRDPPPTRMFPNVMKPEMGEWGQTFEEDESAKGAQPLPSDLTPRPDLKSQNSPPDVAAKSIISPHISRFEVSSEIPGRAKQFYEKAFGWSITKWTGPVEYYVINSRMKENGTDGGIGARTNRRASIVVTFDVANVDETLKLIIAAGGRIITPTKAIPGIGLYACCQDTEGNVFAIRQST